MAQRTKAITQLPAMNANTVAGDDVIPIVDVSGDVTNQVTQDNYLYRTLPRDSRTTGTLRAYLNVNAVVNVQDYGATGDGSTDDTAAIQAAIDAAVGNSGTQTVVFPSGAYRCTGGLLLTTGLLLRGACPPGSSVNPGTQSILLHDFDGDFLQFTGAAGAGAGAAGGLENLQLRQVYGLGGGPGRGKAIVLTGTTTDLRVNWMRFTNVNIENVSGADEWTWGVYADGTPVGTTNGLRDCFFHNCRITANTASGGGIALLNCFNFFFTNVELSLTNTRFLVSGTSGNASASIFLANVTGNVLACDYVSNVYVTGGTFTAVTLTANTSDITVLAGAMTSAPTMAGSNNLVGGKIGGTYLSWSTENTAAKYARDLGAGDSTNLIQFSVGNSGTNEGEYLTRYTNAAPTGGPTAGHRFLPRNNADTSNFDGGGLTFSKLGGVDQTTALIETTGGSLTVGASGTGTFTGGVTASGGPLIITTSAPPASAVATGVTGTVAWDSGFIYLCVAPNTWKRVAVSTW